MNIVYIIIFFLYYLNIFLFTVYGFNFLNHFICCIYDFHLLTILEPKGIPPLGSLEKEPLFTKIELLDENENSQERIARIRAIANVLLEKEKAKMRNKTHLCIAANKAWRVAWALEAIEWEEASRKEEEASRVLRWVKFWEEFKEVKPKPPELQ
jgi:hypothetical protein